MIAAERDCFAKIEYTRSALEAVTEWAQYVYRRNLKVYGMFALAVGCWDHPAAGEHNFTLNWLWHYTPLCGGNSSCSFRINKWYWDKQTNIETNEWYTHYTISQNKSFVRFVFRFSNGICVVFMRESIQNTQHHRSVVDFVCVCVYSCTIQIRINVYLLFDVCKANSRTSHMYRLKLKM